MRFSALALLLAERLLRRAEGLLGLVDLLLRHAEIEATALEDLLTRDAHLLLVTARLGGRLHGELLGLRAQRVDPPQLRANGYQLIDRPRELPRNRRRAVVGERAEVALAVCHPGAWRCAEAA